MSGLKQRRGGVNPPKTVQEEGSEAEPLLATDDKNLKYKSQKKLENERKAKYVLWFTLTLWVVMIIFIFMKVGESLYMAYLKKHGLLQHYQPYL